MAETEYTIRPYHRANAVRYARRWALTRNPLYPDYTGIGGDCTNFVSQALLAGSCRENFTPDFGWYYVSLDDRAPAWTSVEYLYDFLTGSAGFDAENGGFGPFGVEVSRREAEIGDIIQLADRAGDYYHSLFITRIDPPAAGGEIFVCAHSDDHLDRPLSDYNYASFRVLHILGVRLETEYPCFRALFDGVLPPEPVPDEPLRE